MVRLGVDEGQPLAVQQWYVLYRGEEGMGKGGNG